jgi:hypothetical protein
MGVDVRICVSLLSHHERCDPGIVLWQCGIVGVEWLSLPLMSCITQRVTRGGLAETAADRAASTDDKQVLYSSLCL